MNLDSNQQLDSQMPHGILETSLCVDNLTIAEQFYTSVLNLKKYSEQSGRHVFFRCGEGMLLLFHAATTSQPGEVAGQLMPPHGTTGAGHIAFKMFESEIDSWRNRLQAAGVSIESEIQWPEGGYSLYFRDPAGNSLELATPKLWGLPEKKLEPH